MLLLTLLTLGSVWMPTRSGLGADCMGLCSTQQMDAVTPPMMLSLSLPACLVCRQCFQDSHLSLRLPISLQVSVPVSKSGSTGTSGGSGQNAEARGSRPGPASWFRIRGSEISHLESEDRCLSTCCTNQHFLCHPIWLKPCSACN